MDDLTEFERAAVAALALWESRVCERGGAFDPSKRFYDMFFQCMENLQLAAELDARVRSAYAGMKPDVDVKPADAYFGRPVEMAGNTPQQ